MKMNIRIYKHGKEILGEALAQCLREESVSVFETMVIYGRKIFRLDEHVGRFLESMRTCGFVPLKKKVALKAIDSALSAFWKSSVSSSSERFFVRLMMVEDELWVMIGQRKLRNFSAQGVPLISSSFRRPMDRALPAQVKTNAYQVSMMAGLDALENPSFESLMFDSQGYVSEVRVGNIFMIKREQIFTPSCAGILNGVTRQFVLECARELRLKTQETLLTRHDFFNADEVFLTNTSWEILPVSELDGRKIKQPIPGQVTLRLQEQFKRKVFQECQLSK